MSVIQIKVRIVMILPTNMLAHRSGCGRVSNMRLVAALLFNHTCPRHQTGVDVEMPNVRTDLKELPLQRASLEVILIPKIFKTDQTRTR